MGVNPKMERLATLRQSKNRLDSNEFSLSEVTESLLQVRLKGPLGERKRVPPPVPPPPPTPPRVALVLQERAARSLN